MASEPPFKTPPYASYTSFSNYLEHLRGKALPSRIDQTVMTHLNYGTRQALMAALRSLNLIGDGDTPTDDLEMLVEASADDRRELLLAAMKRCYPYLFDGAIDLGRATTGEFHARVRDSTNAQGSTLEKASSFFYALAADAGFELSPHLAARKKPINGSTVKRSKAKSKKPPPVEGAAVTPDSSTTAQVPTMAKQLLDKFPTFDPAWPDNIKEQWFAGFERLMASAEKQQ